jgi:transposase
MAIRHLVSIVTPHTFDRWLNGAKWRKGTKPRKPGRPRTPEEIEQLILRIARETGWGYTRILGELKKLGINTVSRSTVVNILKRAGRRTHSAGRRRTPSVPKSLSVHDATAGSALQTHFHGFRKGEGSRCPL